MSAASFKYRLGVSIHKVSDQNLHHEWQWLAVMTHSYLHELLMVGVDKHIIIYPNCGPWTITQNHYGVFSHISVCNGKTKAWCWLAWKRHLSMKQGSLFCFVLFVPMRYTEMGCFRSRSWSLWKALEEEGCISLVSCRLDLGCKSSWILNDFFTEN
jgi:hypothetical protein